MPPPLSRPTKAWDPKSPANRADRDLKGHRKAAFVVLGAAAWRAGQLVLSFRRLVGPRSRTSAPVRAGPPNHRGSIAHSGSGIGSRSRCTRSAPIAIARAPRVVDRSEPSSRSTAATSHGGRGAVAGSLASSSPISSRSEADALGEDDEGDTPQHRSGIAPVARAGPLGADQAAILVETQRRGRDSASPRDLAEIVSSSARSRRKAKFGLDFKFT